MSTTTIHIPLAAGISVPACLARPRADVEPSGATVILAHGAGTDMHHPFVSAIHTGLACHGHGCVKFNFPYTAQGRRRPDRAPLLESCFASVIDHVRQADGSNSKFLVIGGRSMGGRIATHLAAHGTNIDGLLLLAYPLHPASKPDRLRSDHFSDIRVPTLFFSGSRDALAELGLLRQALERLSAPHRLCIIEGADHSFHTRKSQGVTAAEIVAEIVATTDAWLRRSVCRPSPSAHPSRTRRDM